MQEEAFLQRVAGALGRQAPLRQAPERQEVGPPQFWREKAAESGAPLTRFCQVLEALTGRVAVVQGPAEVQATLQAWLQELGARTVVAWDDRRLHPFLQELAGIQVDWWAGERPAGQRIERAAQADVGITAADYLIAYTGTVALLTTPEHGRSVSLLPPVHIVIAEAASLILTMTDVMEELTKRRQVSQLPTAVDFITGPSRTSDIEMDLSIGVHGPAKIWVIIAEMPLVTPTAP